MQDLNVAVVQADLEWENCEVNLVRFDENLKQLHANTDLLVLPEMFNTGFSINPKKIAEKADGRAFSWMQEKASMLNCAVTGSILIEESGNYFNRLFWISPDGTFETYDKRHLFRMGREFQIVTAGKNRNIIELKGWKILPLICYDLRFPVWSKNRYQDNNYEYDLLIYVANWPVPRSFAWQQLLIARAIENQAYCIGTNRVGRDGKNIAHSGDSVILDFHGNIITKAETNKVQIIYGTLSQAPLHQFRNEFTVGADWDEFELKI
jgi:predicted amidohydrolase